VLGAISAAIWTIFIIVAVKYAGSIRISYARGLHIQHPRGCGEDRAG
jgi:hypothetical protein